MLKLYIFRKKIHTSKYIMVIELSGVQFGLKSYA